METKILPQPIQFIISFFLLIAFNSNAANYVTLSNGNWSDPTIWSKDGGESSCNCVPPQPTNGNNIYVNHVLDLSSNITISGGSYMQITAYKGKLLWDGIAGGSVTVKNGHFYVNNTVDLNQLVVSINGTVTIVGYSELYIHNIIVVYGTFNFYGGYLIVSNGNLTFETGSNVTLTNFSKIEVQQGNVKNDGNLFISGTSCIETSGAWQNLANGTVSGSGSAVSNNGTFLNDGTWQATVNWCGLGNPQNMPPENCPGSNSVCGMLVLGATFGDIEALLEKKDVMIHWTTLSERDNDHFIVQRSADGSNFDNLGSVDGTGFSEKELEYQFIDKSPVNGVNYYRLEQYNKDGESDYTKTVAVLVRANDESFILKSYNLLGEEVDESWNGVVIDLYDDGHTTKRFQNVK